MTDPNVVELQVPNTAEYVGVVRDFIADVAKRLDFNPVDVDDLRLAVGEACANAVRHGCSGPEPCMIHILCRTSDNGIEVEIHNQVHDGAEQPKICTVCRPTPNGGMGLYMMRKLMDEVDLDWSDGWAVVRLVKKLSR